LRSYKWIRRWKEKGKHLRLIDTKVVCLCNSEKEKKATRENLREMSNPRARLWLKWQALSSNPGNQKLTPIKKMWR
jgi:hypothetical protein